MSEVLSFLSRCEGRNPQLCERLRASLSLVTSAIHVYGANELVLSFNGGKDSTAVLHLLRAALVIRYGEAGARGDGVTLGGVRVVYFESSAGNDFAEVKAFMSACEREWGFRVEHLGDFRSGLSALVASGSRGVLMGTRDGDPDARALTGPFSPTTNGWPPIMRVCPLLAWRYADLWAILRGSSLRVCELYERGYTSLGDVDSSKPNPALRVGTAAAECSCARPTDDCSCERARHAGREYLPAWELLDGGLERAGRF